ncbi:MAG: 3',5'-cyclic-nucleotide phosphodiesterase [Azospira oryzae]|nr:MAG: 3',5'-cyclic-nucleotide phosphodiesterase [Azospira oryzae]
MKSFLTYRFCLFLILIPALVFSQSPPSFKIIPLGVKGGIDESNLSSYVLAVEGTEEYVCLDAGTLHYGIQKAIAAGIWKGDATELLKNKVKGYLISHGHLDHLSGLVTNSPDDSAKPIYAMAPCIEVLKEKYFSWKSWANFANEGEKPALGKYHYVVLQQATALPLEQTSMSVIAFTLSHSNPYQSTAFLIRHQEEYVLYLGDTGADEIEKANNLRMLWQEVSPLITTKKLKGIFIEVSFSNEQPNQSLFGHLTPRLLMNEMNVLSEFTGEKALKGFPILITHMKPAGNREAVIKKQLSESNQLGLKLIFPEQAKLIKL